ncbi:MAG: sulfur carrier protein ThiS [Flavobacteriales bacterium]|nr:sulfur carrier protein ThiS [Flavobacteriales bacterium]
MEITVNNKPIKVQSNLKLSEYLSAHSLSNARGTAVAVNDCVIAKSEWQRLVLQENDQVLIIRATQGG